jgi:hypothetical protein
VGALSFDVKVAEAADRVPVYFLPWSSQVLVEMTIPEKKTWTDEPDDPPVFFTAAFNECSVFVEGEPSWTAPSHRCLNEGACRNRSTFRCPSPSPADDHLCFWCQAR